MIAGGKIADLGPAGTAVPPEAQTVDMSGLDAGSWPGMVDAGSTIGLFEIGSLNGPNHADAAQFQPELRSSSALHPDSGCICSSPLRPDPRAASSRARDA